MSNIDNLILVSMDNAHEIIPKYISENSVIIGSYDDMMETVLRMIKQKHFFNMDKNILRGCMEDLTYMYCPGDDVNKDRVMGMLEPSDDEDEDEDEDDSDDEGVTIPSIKRNSLVISDIGDDDA
jgi:hypothetical protein